MRAAYVTTLLPAVAFLIAAMIRQATRLDQRGSSTALATKAARDLTGLLSETRVSVMNVEIQTRRLADL